jgi:hypothetical protein
MNAIYSRLAFGLLFAPACLLPLTAGAQDREMRDLQGFDAIEVSGGIDLNIQQGPEYIVEVVASAGDAARVSTEVDGSTLEIRQQRTTSGLFNWFNSYSVNVTLPALESLTASGGSDIRAEGVISGDTLTLRATGGSDVVIDVDLTEFDVRTSGGSDVVLRGTAQSLRVETSGGSDLDAQRLEAEDAYVQSSGGSDITLTALNRIDVRASGGSDVSYSGDPEFVNIDAAGSADVSKR